MDRFQLPGEHFRFGGTIALFSSKVLHQVSKVVCIFDGFDAEEEAAALAFRFREMSRLVDATVDVVGIGSSPDVLPERTSCRLWTESAQS